VLPGWLVPAAATIVALVLVITLGGALVDRSRQGAVRRELDGLEARLERQATPASVPPRPSAATYLEIITRQEEQAQWDAAFATAQTALTDPALTPADQQALAEHAVAAGLNALWATKAAPADPQAQRRAVERVVTLRRLAATYDVAVPLTNRQLAERAYQVALFRLAKEAFEQALAGGEVTTTDQLQVQFYASTLYNLGFHEATAGQDAATRDDGLRLLLAAYRIDLAYQLGSGLAWGALTQLLGPDERRWTITPAPTPLLAPAVPSGHPQRVE
jgi:hypothetical protein